MKYSVLLALLITISWVCLKSFACTRTTLHEKILVDAAETIFIESRELQDFYLHLQAIAFCKISLCHLTTDQHALYQAFLGSCVHTKKILTTYLQTLKELRLILKHLAKKISKSTHKSTIADFRNKIVELLIKIKKSSHTLWLVPDQQPLLLEMFSECINQIGELSPVEKDALHEFTQIVLRRRFLCRNLMLKGSAYARIVKAYRDQMQMTHVCSQSFNNEAISNDYPSIDSIVTISHIPLQLWFEDTIEEPYAESKDPRLVLSSVVSLYGQPDSNEVVKQAVRDQEEAEIVVRKERERFENEGSVLLQELNEARAKISDCKLCCTHPAALQFLAVYEQIALLHPCKKSALNLRDFLSSATTRLLLYLIDRDNRQIRHFANTLENALDEVNIVLKQS